MVMTLKKLFLTLFLFLIAAASLSAASLEFSYDYEYDGRLRDPDTRKRRDDDLIGVIIKTNVEGAEVYINGKLFGKTPVATVDLSATYYNLEIRKSGYDTIRCKIYPKRNYTYTYNFTMLKTCGYINVSNIPSGSTVYIDGVSHSYFPVEVDPGSHTVKVRKFGYEDFSSQVRVENHKTVNTSVSLKPAPFSISNFRLSKDYINPDYHSGIGKVNFSFYVTNDGSALLTVNDRYGNAVWSHQYYSFSTWEQSISWDGRGSDGERLPDGSYTVNLTSFDYDFTQKIKIDRSLIYPLSVPTNSGSGIGTLPAAFSNRMNYVKLYTSFGPMLSVKDNSLSLYSLPVNGGLLVDFAKHFEFGLSFGIAAATDSAVADGRAPVNGGISFKGTGSIDLTPDLSFNYAGLIHYNYFSAYDFAPANTDLGNGLGFGASLGVESSMFYLGLSAEYALGKTMVTKRSNRLAQGEKAADILKCGAILSVLPSANLRTSLWGALHNAQVVEAGLELITMPAASAFCFDTKAWILTDLDSKGKNIMINAQIGLSYLF